MSSNEAHIVPLAHARRAREVKRLSEAIARARRDRTAGAGPGRRLPGFRPCAHYLVDDGEDRRGLRVGVIAWLTVAMTACVLAGGALLLQLAPGPL